MPVYRNDLGQLHREDGPAIVQGDFKYFYKNGKRHNLNGPAIIGQYEKEYWIEGKKYEKEEWLKIVRKLKLEKLLK